MIKQFRYLFLLLSFSLFAQEYHVDKTKENTVKFISDAPIEDIEGVTNNIDGYIYLPDPFTADSSEVYFEVDLRTLDTGIGLRNRHMRDNYLETDKYPYASFKGIITQRAEKDENSFELKVHGEMQIHGVSKEMELTGIMQKYGDDLKIISRFEVKLSDHNINIPRFMFLKIDETMKIELEFFVKKL